MSVSFIDRPLNSGLTSVNSSKNHVGSSGERPVRVVLQRSSSWPNLGPAKEQSYGTGRPWFPNCHVRSQANGGESHVTSDRNYTVSVVLNSSPESSSKLAPTDHQHYHTVVPPSDNVTTKADRKESGSSDLRQFAQPLDKIKEELEQSREEVQGSVNEQLSKIEKIFKEALHQSKAEVTDSFDKKLSELTQKASDYENLINQMLVTPGWIEIFGEEGSINEQLSKLIYRFQNSKGLVKQDIHSDLAPHKQSLQAQMEGEMRRLVTRFDFRIKWLNDFAVPLHGVQILIRQRLDAITQSLHNLLTHIEGEFNLHRPLPDEVLEKVHSLSESFNQFFGDLENCTANFAEFAEDLRQTVNSVGATVDDLNREHDSLCVRWAEL